MSERPERASRDAGRVHEANQPQSASTNGDATESEQAAATPANSAPAPTEAEIRAARSVIARAKAAGVKLTSAGAGGTARIMLPNGESRQAYIVRRWKEKASRTQILAEIKSVGPPHDKCTYQIVFSATKGVEGGPPKADVVTAEGQPVGLVPAPAPAAAE